MSTPEKRQGKKRSVKKNTLAKKLVRQTTPDDSEAESTDDEADSPSLSLLLAQKPTADVPPARYPWLHFATVRTAGGTLSDPDAVAAVERSFEQWRRGLQRETRLASQAASSPRERQEVEQIGFCADAMLDAMRLIHLMRFATLDDRGTPQKKVVAQEWQRLGEATNGWKYHADGPFIGLFPVQPQPITFAGISEDTFALFTHVLACWHLRQIRFDGILLTKDKLQDADVDTLLRLLAICDFRSKASTVNANGDAERLLRADISKCPRPEKPKDQTTRLLIDAVEEGLKAGKSVEQINREFAKENKQLNSAVMTTAKRAERRYRLALARYDSADK